MLKPCSECQGKGYRLFVNGKQVLQQRSVQRWQRPRPAQNLGSPAERLPVRSFETVR
jgi:hypothetical protein